MMLSFENALAKSIFFIFRKASKVRFIGSHQFGK